jgi:hypothetical protein
VRAHRAACAIALLAVAACAAPARSVTTNGSPAIVSPAPSAGTAIADADPVLTLVTRGGRCVYGLCESRLVVHRDGAYTLVVGKDAPRAGHVSRASVDALATAVATADFGRIRSVKFTGTCPTAYDGSELVYTFHTAPGAPEIASCTVAIDAHSPLFEATEAVVAQTRE